MAHQNVVIVACCCILLTSMASSSPLHRGIMKRETETRVDPDDTIKQLYNDTLGIFIDSQINNPHKNRTYELIPISDTELLTTLTEMSLELDQLRILCDLVAMDESVKLSTQTSHNISTIINEELFPHKGSNIIKELCLTYRLSEYIRGSDIKQNALFLNLFNQVQRELYKSPPILHNPN